MDLSALQAKFEATRKKSAVDKQSAADSLSTARFQHLPRRELQDVSRHPYKQPTVEEYAEKAGRASSDPRRDKAQKEFKARQLHVLRQKQQQDTEKRRKSEEAFQKTEAGMAIAALDGPSRKGESKREREDAWQSRRAESIAKAKVDLAGPRDDTSERARPVACTEKVTTKGDCKRNAPESKLTSGALPIADGKNGIEWCPRDGDVPFSKWILQVSKEVDGIVKLSQDGTFLLGSMPVSNTHMTQRIAAELWWHGVSRVCGQGHDRCHEAEYRCRYYKEAAPVGAAPKDEDCKPSSLFVDARQLSTEDLKVFAVGLGMLYDDFGSHFSGNQLLLAAADVMTLLAHRGVKGTIDLTEWTFSGASSVAQFANNMATWLRGTFKNRLAQQDLASTLSKMVKHDMAVKAPVAKTAAFCSRFVIDALGDMEFADHVVARVRITDAFWCELHHLRASGVL